MGYSVFPGGKRLRPALVVLGHRVFGGSDPAVHGLAAAFELAHTFSLIHDDLPCMDDDDYRRGRPTCHKAHGEALAVLAGDALLNLAYETIAELRCDEAARGRLVRLVARAMGGAGVIGGQVDDIAAEGRDLKEAALRSIHLRKTAALIRAALCAGATLASAREEGIAALDDCGRDLGLLFQIVDDLMSVVGDEAVLGRPRGGDERHDKATYPRVLGLDAARRRARSLERSAFRKACSLPSHGAILADLVRVTAARGLGSGDAA